jgi:cardiolipin synthase
MGATHALLINEVEAAAIDLPADHLQLLAGHIADLQQPTVASRHRASSLVPASRFKQAVIRIWSAWDTEHDIDGKTLALMLRSAAAVASSMRAAQSIDISWTGPTSAHVPVRLSSQALLDLIGEARSQLIVVSFAAYKVASVTDAFRFAANRGVDVRLILETAEDSGGKLSKDAADAFRELHDLVSFWVWPKKRRPEGGASMHVKAVVVDGRVALVTSANLTGHALERNMELGLIVRGGAAPRRLTDHFQALMASGNLAQVRPE